ncbi:MAG: pyridoxal-phosphate dependent enzyme [Bdellovibrionales bacterium]|jgi:threonine dehydratase|nr:pyridoxal-phosphate dependent enzyme [Bdellovibrionales bacterium]
MGFISPADIERIAKRISRHLRRTPLESGRGQLSHLLFKREDLQLTNSFTARAALGILMGLSDEQKDRGLVLTTPGNLGWGLAHGLRLLEIPTRLTIVIPEDTVSTKALGLHGQNSHQIEIVRKGFSELERYEIVREISKRTGMSELTLENRKDEVAAKGTIALEIGDDLQPAADQLYEFICPVGSGALAAGCAVWLKHKFGDQVKVTGAEPASANDFAQLFHFNKISAERSPQTAADSLRSPQVREEYQKTLLDLIDDVIEVQEDEIIDAMKLLHRESGIVAEPSSAITVAAAKKSLSPSPKICLLTAANVDQMRYDFYRQ